MTGMYDVRKEAAMRSHSPDRLPSFLYSLVYHPFPFNSIIPTRSIVVNLFGTITAGSTNHRPRQESTTVPMFPENLSGPGQGRTSTVQQCPEYCSCRALRLPYAFFFLFGTCMLFVLPETHRITGTSELLSRSLSPPHSIVDARESPPRFHSGVLRRDGFLQEGPPKALMKSSRRPRACDTKDPSSVQQRVMTDPRQSNSAISYEVKYLCHPVKVYAPGILTSVKMNSRDEAKEADLYDALAGEQQVTAREGGTQFRAPRKAVTVTEWQSIVLPSSLPSTTTAELSAGDSYHLVRTNSTSVTPYSCYCWKGLQIALGATTRYLPTGRYLAHGPRKLSKVGSSRISLLQESE
ncbi:uncharacterized protein BT62DRAFT_1012083 [Guyanagaster necrorhizus]|uniref:Uncharacterized protein n=1 Tax=Guyanagaster necrorhizus TaxID=856835 RepID=A0A9P8AM99_9AGAR|nr:uncharacterized protein BT62DRAFT_1012083 [Guyanagaster necrorhizus MCA 3950]KAG7441048.1 hypothetical protein BT62DRAFT_1012083 [Guyanagaster necrorhizus MCA 3950]